MRHTRVKTTYTIHGEHGVAETLNLYCDHNHSTDITQFYNEDGYKIDMCFGGGEIGNTLLDAMILLWSPFDDEWGKKLKDGVEYYNITFLRS